MAGNNNNKVILQERDRRILAEIGILRFIDRDQAKLIGGFSSLSRANARLAQLLRAGYLERFSFGTIRGGQKSLYALSKAGAAEIAVEYRAPKRTPGHVIGHDGFTAHQFQIARVLVALKYTAPNSIEKAVTELRTFDEPIAPAFPVRPDAYVEVLTGDRMLPMFVEADLGTESLTVLRQKAKNYLQMALSGQFQKLFSRPQFRVLIVSTTEAWLNNIRAMAAKLTDKIFWLTTFTAINNEGIWAPIWQRPIGDQKLPLI